MAPTILALSVNSPFWLGEDTDYGSYRTEIWRRWPTAGTPDPFASRADFDRLAEVLLHTGSIDDPARIHWDVRPSPRFFHPRVPRHRRLSAVDDAVTVPGLVRALVRTCHAQTDKGDPPPLPRAELMRLATWRVARYGLERDLVDVVGEQSLPAAELLQALLDFVRPSSTITASGTSCLAWLNVWSRWARARPGSDARSSAVVSSRTSSTSWSTRQQPPPAAERSRPVWSHRPRGPATGAPGHRQPRPGPPPAPRSRPG